MNDYNKALMCMYMYVLKKHLSIRKQSTWMFMYISVDYTFCLLTPFTIPLNCPSLESDLSDADVATDAQVLEAAQRLQSVLELDEVLPVHCHLKQNSPRLQCCCRLPTTICTLIYKPDTKSQYAKVSEFPA